MQHPRILIIAEPEKLPAYRSAIGGLGAELLSASPRDPLAQPPEHGFALVLLSLEAAQSESLTAARLIRQHPHTCGVPLILIARSPDVLHGLPCQEAAARDPLPASAAGHLPASAADYLTAPPEDDLTAPAVDYLLAPVPPELLRAKVRVFLDLHLARTQLARGEALLAGERLLRAQAEELSRLKDEFLATMSHELRTPLNSIFGWITLVRTGRLDATTQERGLETIERSARAQKRLIEDLLDGSRIITGKIPLELGTVDLLQVVQAALTSMLPAADAKGIELSLRASEALAGSVRGDPARLQQIVYALLSNAVKFTAGGGRIEVVLDGCDGHASIAVCDTGQGIRPEFLPHVFDRFRREDGSLTRRHGGLGLGLAIVQHLVELHGGAVSATSEGEGRGCTFTVKIPMAEMISEAGGAGAPVAAPLGFTA